MSQVERPKPPAADPTRSMSLRKDGAGGRGPDADLALGDPAARPRSEPPEPHPALRFRRVLVANRGEIAVRIIRACRELGLETVAVYSDADAAAGHVRAADVAVRLGPPPPSESYLRSDAVVKAAIEAGAGAVHPGYGFLAERAAFARAVIDAGMVFVGPSPDAIEALGDKLHARRLARSVGVPVVPGTLEPAAIERPDQLPALLAEAEAVGFPLLVKAAAGGGGRGMRRVGRAEDLPTALLDGSHEAASAFGDGRVYLEREIAPARHIEVQLLGDSSGRVVALGERDCSLQRRHQKLVEEAPAPGLRPEERRDLHAMAVAVASAARLTNAATAEFLRDEDGAFHFLEVNTRLQVEHGVTELVTGLDIVQEQLLLASGAPLSPAAIAAAEKAAEPGGHAIEVRIAAEDPGSDFAPGPGPIHRWRMPSGPGVRVDTAVEAGDRVPREYDNLIAKILVHAADRGAAIDRLARALGEAEIAGIQTTVPFHRFVARHPGFRAGRLSTGWVTEHWDGKSERARAWAAAGLAAGLALQAGGDALGTGGVHGMAGSRATTAATAGAAARAATAAGSGPASGAGGSRPRSDGASSQGVHRDVIEGSAWDVAGLEAGVDRWPE